MNPSAPGWIKRYISEDFEILQENASKAEHSIYIQLRSLGFIYGTNITYFSRKHNNQIKLTQEELAKVKTVGIVLYGVSNLYSGPNSLGNEFLYFM